MKTLRFIESRILAMIDIWGLDAFRDLPAGRFTLTAQKSGYMTMQYGQTRPFESGKAIEGGHRNHMRAINTICRAGGLRPAVDQGVLTSGVMYECVTHGVDYVLAGSIRDDGPLPDTVMDLVEAQERYAAELAKNVHLVLMLSSMLHSIGVGNMLPSWVRVVCVDINPATVTKLAEDRAEQLKRDPDRVANELEARLRKDLVRIGDFSRVHPLPRSSADVPDDPDARLVVLPPEHPYSKENGSPAETAAKAILESRGNAPRLFRNTLVFLAADRVRLQDLDEAVRKYLAWSSILEEKNTLNLDPHQVRQAETQRQGADGAVTARLPETYQWVLVPEQKSPQAQVTWEAIRLTGSDALAVRASKKLRSEELLLTELGPSRLRMELDGIPLWRGDHVAVAQLADDFAQYPYLPRVKDSSVLARALGDGVALLTWRTDGFAFADSFDEAQGRYRGLRAGQQISLLDLDSPGLVVKSELARAQLEAEAQPTGAESATATAPFAPYATQGPGRSNEEMPSSAPLPKRFHGSVTLDSTRVGRDASRIAEEVLAHLAGTVGATIKVTLEIEAELPSGAPEHLVRVVTENARTLKFTSQGFESD